MTNKEGQAGLKTTPEPVTVGQVRKQLPPGQTGELSEIAQRTRAAKWIGKVATVFSHNLAS